MYKTDDRQTFGRQTLNGMGIYATDDRATFGRTRVQGLGVLSDNEKVSMNSAWNAFRMADMNTQATSIDTPPGTFEAFITVGAQKFGISREAYAAAYAKAIQENPQATRSTLDTLIKKYAGVSGTTSDYQAVLAQAYANQAARQQAYAQEKAAKGDTTTAAQYQLKAQESMKQATDLAQQSQSGGSTSNSMLSSLSKIPPVAFAVAGGLVVVAIILAKRRKKKAA